MPTEPAANPRARGMPATPRARGTSASDLPRARGTVANPRARVTRAVDALPSPSELPDLPTESMRLVLDCHNLVTTGRRSQLITRLQEAHADGRAAATAHAAGSKPSTSRNSEIPPDTSSGGEATPESGNTANRESEDTSSGGSRDARDASDPPPEDPLLRVYPSSDSDLDTPDPPPPKRDPPPPKRHSHRAKTKGARHTHKRSRRHDTSCSSHDSQASQRRGGSPSPSSSPSSSSYSSSTSSTSSSSTGSSSSDDGHHSHHRCRHRRHSHHGKNRRHRNHHSRRRKHRRRRELVSCIPPLSSRLRHKIIHGEYVNFDRLLLPSDVPPLASASRSGRRKHASRTVSDRASWQESWNQYIATRVAHDPALGLALVKYQAILGMLFNHHPPAACIAYDRLFRQGAARDPSVRWDRMNEEIFVWALTPSSQVQHPADPGPSYSNSRPQHFRAPQPDRNPISARLGPAPSGVPRPYHPGADPPAPHAAVRPPYTPTEPHVSHTPEGREICKRFNFGKCVRQDCRFAHCCWTPSCAGTHPGKGCPKRPF